MRSASLLLLFAILVAVVIACGGLSEPVRVGTSADYPPFNFINDNGEIDGFDRELGDELCRRAELECAWVQNPWESIIQNLIAGDYDAIMDAVAATEERDKIIDFTQPYLLNNPAAYIALAGAGDEAINGKVGVQVNTIHRDYIADTGMTMVEFSLAEELIAAVRSGEVDAVFSGKVVLASFVAESGGELAFVGPEVTIESADISVGVRQGNSELKDKLDAGIAAMKADGTLNGLIRKWFGEDAETF